MSGNVISNNGYGIFAVGANAKIWATGNTVSGTTNQGFLNDGAIFESAGDNAVRNNGANSLGTITYVGRM